MRTLLFMPPLIQLLVFGYAVNLDIEKARIAWMDLDRTPESRELRAAFEGSRYFHIAATASQEGEVQGLLDRAQVQAVVRALPGFARDIQRGRTAVVQILIDGTNSNTASIISNYVVQILGEYSNRLLADQQRARLVARTMITGSPVTMSIPALDVRRRVWFNPDLQSRNYFVPAVVVNIITLVTMMLTAMAIVREKEIGTMEQLMVTPIQPIELMLGKTLPFALVGLFELALVTTAALLIFHIPFRGSALVLLLCASLFLMTTLGIGLLISTVSQTQQQAMMVSSFFFTPAFMLSGFTFPVRNMPLPIQYISYLNPVRYFIEIVRGIFLKGIGVSYLWPQILALLVFGIAILVISALRYHKHLD